jgi:hypothetical protein
MQDDELELSELVFPGVPPTPPTTSIGGGSNSSSSAAVGELAEWQRLSRSMQVRLDVC